MTENYRDKALKNALFFPFLWECGRGPADTRSTAGFPASPGGSSLLFTFLFSQARAARGIGAGKSRSGKQPKVKAEPEAQIIAAVTPPVTAGLPAEPRGAADASSGAIIATQALDARRPRGLSAAGRAQCHAAVATCSCGSCHGAPPLPGLPHACSPPRLLGRGAPAERSQADRLRGGSAPCARQGAAPLPLTSRGVNSCRLQPPGAP